jgi:hypothetical protein
MLDILRQSLKSAQDEVTSLALAGKSTAGARDEVIDLETRIAIEERRLANEAAAAQDDYHAGIRTEGRRIARETLAALNKRLAAFDLTHVKA